MSKEAVFRFVMRSKPAFLAEFTALANACQRGKQLVGHDNSTVHREELYLQRKQLESFLLGGLLATGQDVSAGAEVNGGSIIDVLDQVEHEGYHPPV